MAKRKRASLKDKNAESLGLSQKKGKGLDVLFGGPLDQDEELESDIDSDAEQEDETLTGAPADFAEYDGRAVDELGLPVALEAPPDDLILASTPLGSPTVGEADAVNPATSPFAMPDLEESTASGTPKDANDFTGILDTDKSSTVEEENLSNSERENDLSGIVEGSPSFGSRADEADLSGLIVEDDLSGLVAEAPAAPETPAGDELAGLTAASLEDTPPADTVEDLSGMVTADEDLSGLTSDVGSSPSGLPPAAPPPTTAAPINVPSSAPQTPSGSSAETESSTSTPYTPPPTVPPPTPTTSAPPGLSPPPKTRVDSFSGIVTEGGPVSTRDILPEDALTEAGDHILAVEKRERLDRDDSTAEKIARYIGPERRQKLDEEIMDLYDVVANELSDSKDDAAFALKTLREAQDIIIEDISQYDEALYRVAVVRTMLVRKRNLQQWSYSWGMVVFGYAIVWLVAFVAGIELFDPVVTGINPGAAAIRSAWLAALSGGIGGCIAILYSLSWRVAIKHEFDRQYIMKYLVQPVMGFILGAVIFFITSAGFLTVSPETANTSQAFLGGPQLVAFQILLGFVAGFRQRLVYYMIDRIVQRITPEATESKAPTSVVPTDDYRRLSSSGD